ncbi:hypothetical protein GIB67_003148 [Kingdonia uniflora]|uniref:Uncharacterized protein n=1 Tax=Kingdonia uniflora TaxID=39325 RepID=A0A7J7N6D3_9MAGN|nr:hypothetical protein GIB67_003148 [Kingdonia uniflora]
MPTSQNYVSRIKRQQWGICLAIAIEFRQPQHLGKQKEFTCIDIINMYLIIIERLVC